VLADVSVGASWVSIDGAPTVTAVADSLINITCHASPSRPPVDVTWYTSFQNEAAAIESEAARVTHATELADGKRYNVTSVLTVAVNRSDNDRLYRCSVVNVAMTTPVSATVQLTVHCKLISSFVHSYSLRLLVLHVCDFISASLSISILSGALMIRACRLEHLSVCLSVCPEVFLWQNFRLDPDAVWGGEWGRSRDGCIRCGW